VMTVSETIASLYEKMYKVRPLVVRNFGRNTEHITPYSREDIHIATDDLLIIIQGTGINMDKGAEELIDAVNISDGVALMVAGSGDVVPHLKQMVKELKIEHKVTFIPPVSWELLMKYTKSADVGMCLEKDTNLNYRFSLANKLFDYISAGKPVIASDIPEVRKIVRENNCGIIIPTVSPEEIIKALLELKKNRDLLTELTNNAVTVSGSINWERESLKVTELYNSILS
jgi:glycosyltransferase involved in cell wall biosynthesis